MNETFLKNPLNLLSNNKTTSYSSIDNKTNQPKIPKKSFESYVSEKTQSKDLPPKVFDNKKEQPSIKNETKQTDKNTQKDKQTLQSESDIAQYNPLQKNSDNLLQPVSENKKIEETFIPSLIIDEAINAISDKSDKEELSFDNTAITNEIFSSQEFMSIPSLALVDTQTPIPENIPLNSESVLGTISVNSQTLPDSNSAMNYVLLSDAKPESLLENNFLQNIMIDDTENPMAIPPEETDFSELKFAELLNFSDNENVAPELNQINMVLEANPFDNGIPDKDSSIQGVNMPNINHVTNVIPNLIEQQQIVNFQKIEPQLIGQIPLGNEISVQITKQADNPNKIGINLEPAGMGEVELVIENNNLDNTVIAVIRSEKPEILDALRKEAASLEKYLSEAGINLSGGSLGFEHKQQQQESASPSEQNKILYSAELENQNQSNNRNHENASEKAYMKIGNLKSLSGIDLRL